MQEVTICKSVSISMPTVPQRCLGLPGCWRAQYIIPDEDPKTANTWIVQALTPIEHFNNVLSCEFSDDEVETVGGLLLQEIGLVSDLQGQIVEIDNWEFTILEADSRTIHLIRAKRK
mgnify:CR=1 FL=1